MVLRVSNCGFNCGIPFFKGATAGGGSRREGGGRRRGSGGFIDSPIEYSERILRLRGRGNPFAKGAIV